MTWKDKLGTILLTLVIAAAILLTLLSFTRGLTRMLNGPADSLSAPRSDMEKSRLSTWSMISMRPASAPQ